MESAVNFFVLGTNATSAGCVHFCTFLRKEGNVTLCSYL